MCNPAIRKYIFQKLILIIKTQTAIGQIGNVLKEQHVQVLLSNSSKVYQSP